MTNKFKAITGYIFLILFSLFALTLQANTVNIVNRSVLAQTYTGDGFVDKSGNQQDPLDIGISNEEVYEFLMKYLPTAIAVIIIGLVIIIVYQYTQIKRIVKPGYIQIENQNTMNESDIYQLIPHYEKEKFINDRYDDFLEIKRAYLSNNRFKLKKKLTDQMFDQYCQQIDNFQCRGEVHTIRDTRFRGAIIKNIEQVNTMLILTLELKVCYYEFVEKNNALVYGHRDKKVVAYYELKFVTDLRDFISECPHCGCKSVDTFQHTCEYCNQTVEETDLKWYLNQENIVIKSYGDDI